jgi:multidrug efflux system outer membrane protein
VQAGSLPNPHFAIDRFTEGSKVEIERFLKFDVLGLLTLPWRAQWAGQQSELARLQAAQDVVRTAADTRKRLDSRRGCRPDRAVHARREGGGRSRRRAGPPHGPRGQLEQAAAGARTGTAGRRHAQLARAEQAALASREQLTRLMGLWGAQAQYALPQAPARRCPRPCQRPPTSKPARCASGWTCGRAQLEARFVAQSLGYTRATGFINALDIGYGRNTTFNNANGERETKKGFEVEAATARL